MEIRKTSGTYHRTSVDVAKTTYTTVSRAGQKRTFEEAQDREEDLRPPPPPPLSITYKGDFQRPRVQEKLFTPLKSGEISDVYSQDNTEYSQRRVLALTPNPTSNPLLDLAHPSYGLPPRLVSNFALLGVKSIYPWQSECLVRSGALRGDRNLVYTAPTGGGKSLVADILMLKKVIECPGKKALLVVPYVALVQEKLRWIRKLVEGISKIDPVSPRKQQNQMFRRLGNEDSVRVVGFFGGSKLRASWPDMDIAICTIEKVDATQSKF